MDQRSVALPRRSGWSRRPGARVRGSSSRGTAIGSKRRERLQGWADRARARWSLMARRSGRWADPSWATLENTAAWPDRPADPAVCTALVRSQECEDVVNRSRQRDYGPLHSNVA